MKEVITTSVSIIKNVRASKLRGTLAEVKQYIEIHYNEEITLKSIASRFYINPGYLSQLFKKELNCNYIDYLTNTRIANAKLLLLNSVHSISEISNLVGYSNVRYFNRLFKKHIGITPSKYRKSER